MPETGIQPEYKWKKNVLEVLVENEVILAIERAGYIHLFKGIIELLLSLILYILLLLSLSYSYYLSLFYLYYLSLSYLYYLSFSYCIKPLFIGTFGLFYL